MKNLSKKEKSPRHSNEAEGKKEGAPERKESEVSEARDKLRIQGRKYGEWGTPLLVPNLPSWSRASPNAWSEGGPHERSRHNYERGGMLRETEGDDVSKKRQPYIM